MSKLIDKLDNSIIRAERMPYNYDTSQLWEDVAQEVLAAYPKLGAVVIAAEQLANGPSGNFAIYLAILRKALAAMDEGI